MRAEILLFQLHGFFIRDIEVPIAEKFASIPRVCLRVNEVPAEGLCHAAMKIKFVICIMGKYVNLHSRARREICQLFCPILRLLHLRQCISHKTKQKLNVHVTNNSDISF